MKRGWQTGWVRILQAATMPIASLPGLPLATPAIAAIAPDSPPPSAASGLPAPELSPELSYADLATLIESSTLILKAMPVKAIALPPARAGDVRPGWARLYVEAQPIAALKGEISDSGLVAYLVDMPLDPRGKPPAFKKTLKNTTVLLFARDSVPPATPASGHGAPPPPPLMLRLFARDSQFAWDVELENRVRALTAELAAPGAPAPVTTLREISYVPGDLVGAGETQIFLATRAGKPASISVEHSPNAPTRWNISFTEVIDVGAPPPPRDTLLWYRLACFLPRAIPKGADISDTEEDSAQAARDYALVLGALGPCTRVYTGG